MNSGHTEVHTLMGAYVLGGLEEHESRLFERHLTVCAECREELAGLTPLLGLLRRTTLSGPGNVPRASAGGPFGVPFGVPFASEPGIPEPFAGDAPVGGPFGREPFVAGRFIGESSVGESHVGESSVGEPAAEEHPLRQQLDRKPPSGERPGRERSVEEQSFEERSGRQRPFGRRPHRETPSVKRPGRDLSAGGRAIGGEPSAGGSRPGEPSVGAQLPGEPSLRETAPRQGRWKAPARWCALAAALCAAALLGGILTRGGPAGGEPAWAFVAASGARVSGEARLTAKPWGTAVDIDLHHLPVTGSFTLRVASDDGHTQQAATWGATPGAVAKVTGASSVPPGHIRSLSVLDRSGRVLATVRPS
ncbi:MULTISPECIES: zf-HC2 domain-containing protein [unclassified Streptomyces]|uniref:zf-HC2 domain-containing protein n=1 Tax=unclassified Streptomyces TaxID=2593676 RepID=UPI0036E0DC94